MTASSAIRFRQLTSPRAGAIAVLELNGPADDLAALIAQHSRVSGAAVAHGVWHAADGSPIDELLVVRHAPDCVELHLHGGRGVVQAMRQCLLTAGATETRVADDPLWNAATARLAKVLLAQPQVVPDWCNQLRAAIDENQEAKLHELLQLAADGAAIARHILHPPPTVVLVGRPNAGKSTLFNALLGASRVIVSDEAGTTRDAIDATIAIDGIPVRLVDTAGFDPTADRLSENRLERRGQVKALRALRNADLVLHVTERLSEGPGRLVQLAAPRLQLVSKCDLPDATERQSQLASPDVSDGVLKTPIHVSGRTGQNLDALRRAIAFALRLPVAGNRIPPVPLGTDAPHDALRQRLCTAKPASASVPELRSLAASLLAHFSLIDSDEAP